MYPALFLMHLPTDLWLLLFAGFVAGSPIAPALSKISLTKSSYLVDGNGVVKLGSLEKELSKVQRKIAQGFSSFEKNTGSIHPFASTRRWADRAVGSENLTDDSSTLWQGTMSVGNPPQTFTVALWHKVDFDTGSSDIFLPDIQCHENCQGHAMYDPSASSTSRDLGVPFTLQYADGSYVQGIQFSDTVAVAGLTATSQTLGAATVYSEALSINSFPPDSLLGMAFPSISVFDANPLFQSIVAQGQTDMPVFAFKLSSNNSELSLGGIDTSLYNGPLVRNAVTITGYWQVGLDSVTVNGDSSITGLSVIIDTGTTLIVGDPANVTELYTSIPGSKPSSSEGYFTVPCNAIPSISLTFNGTAFPISPESFNLGPVSEGSQDCIGGIASAELGGAWVIGDVFLQNVYTVFDVGNEQVGFAKLA